MCSAAESQPGGRLLCCSRTSVLRGLLQLGISSSNTADRRNRLRHGAAQKHSGETHTCAAARRRRAAPWSGKPKRLQARTRPVVARPSWLPLLDPAGLRVSNDWRSGRAAAASCGPVSGWFGDPGAYQAIGSASAAGAAT